MTLRRATDADRDAVVALGVAEEAAWFGEPELSAQEVGEWIDGEGGPAVGVVAFDGEAVLGYASPGRLAAVFVVDPAAVDGVADELLTWLVPQRDEVELMTFAGDTRRLAAFARHGLTHRRSSFFMVRPASAGPVPPATFPDGVDVAPYRLGDADEAVHRLIYVGAAWAAVSGHAERDLDEWLEKERQCRSLFLARRDHDLVGWVAGRLLDSGRGYVTTLAVEISERGRGLGRALLLRAFEDLQLAGARDLSLDVEAENEAALGLYRSVSLNVAREWCVYATTV